MAAKNIPAVSIMDFFASAKQILDNPLPFHKKNFEELGDTFQVKVSFTRSVILSRNPDFARYVLQQKQKEFRKSSIQTQDVAKYVGQGLLTIEGEHWRRQRRLIQPAFHKEHLKNLLDSIQKTISEELDQITTAHVVDIFPVFNDLAFKTVVGSLFSGAASPLEIKRLQHITEATQKMLVKELRQFYKKWWFRMRGRIRHHKNLTREARDILKGIVEERKGQSEKTGDLLDMLLEARYEDGTTMMEEQLLDEILILFTAGHETTSNALTFTAELLARHPQVQEKIFDEVDAARKNSSSLFDYLQQCTYTKQVIEESMRLYPPAYFIDRTNEREDEFGGLRIPSGSSVLFSMYEIHRHPHFWTDPGVFRPERFSGGERNIHYYPFGAGPRKCIGNNFAMYEMVLAVSEMMHRYRIDLKQGPIEVNPLITLKPKNAVLQFNYR